MGGKLAVEGGVAVEELSMPGLFRGDDIVERRVRDGHLRQEIHHLRGQGRLENQ